MTTPIFTQFVPVNVGESPNDGTGDTLRVAFTKVNGNFANIGSVGLETNNLVVSGSTQFTNTLDSSGVTSGAVQVLGGLGVAGNIFSSESTTNTLNASTVNASTVNTALVLASSLTGTLQTSSQPNITTVGTLTSLAVGNGAATSTATGALTVGGGVGIGGDTYIGGNLFVQGLQTVTNKQTVLVSEMVASNLNVGYVIANSLSANSNVASTSTTTGALTVAGGVGIVGDEYVGGNVHSQNIYTTNVTGTLQTPAQPNITSVGTINNLAVAGPASTSLSTGALTVAGGIGATGNVFAQAIYTNGLYWAANNNVMSTGSGSGGQPAGLNTQIQYNNGGAFGATSLEFIAANGAIIATGNLNSTSSTTGTMQILGGLGVTGNVNAANFYGSFNGNGAGLTNLPNSAFANSGIVIQTGAGLSGGNSSPVTLGNTVTITNTGVLSTIAGSGINVSSATGNVTITNSGVTSVASGIGMSVTASTGAVTINNQGVVQLNPNVGIGLSSSTGTITVTNLGVTQLLGTTNQINATNSTGNIILSLPQSIAVTSSPAFSGISLSGITHTGTNGSGDIGASGATFGTVWVANVTASSTISAPTHTGTTGTFTGNVSAGKFIGDGSGLINVSAGNFTTANVAAYLPTYGGNISATLTTAAQPNITSVGTLGNLTVTGNVTANGYLGTQYGNVNTISGVFSGNVNAGNIIATQFGNSYGATASYTSNVSIGVLTLTGNVSTAIINGGSTGVGNIGSSTNTFNTVFAKATTAQYADLAENYVADAVYPAGTVLVFGGANEVTVSSTFADPSVAGVVSTNPAYLMNSELVGTPIALRGRVPVIVMGQALKGDLLVTGSNPGTAISVGKDKTYGVAVFAKALEDKRTYETGVIEAVII